jgi:hypothetical protein
MIRVIGVLFAVMGTCSLFAADFSTYRGVRFGIDLAAAANFRP